MENNLNLLREFFQALGIFFAEYAKKESFTNQEKKVELQENATQTPTQSSSTVRKPNEIVPLFIQPREPLFKLSSEYTNPKFHQNIRLLREKRVNWLMRIRGDGNCFYRAFAFLFLNHIFKTKESQGESIIPIMDRLDLHKRWGEACKKTNQTSEDYQKVFIHLNLIGEALKHFDSLNNEDQLMQFMNDPEFSQRIVNLLRLITGLEMLENGSTLEPYILSLEPSVFAYVSKRVLIMGEEAEEMEIQYLTRSFCQRNIFDSSDQRSIPLRLEIMYLDSSERELMIYSYPLSSDNKDNVSEGGFRMLYRSGHYDVLM